MSDTTLSERLKAMVQELKEMSERPYREKTVLVDQGFGVYTVERRRVYPRAGCGCTKITQEEGEGDGD